MYGGGSHARTLALFALVAVQVGHTFNCRSRIESATAGLFKNIHIWAATATVIALQILAIEFRPLARLLDLTRLSAADLIVVASCLLLPIAIVETQKLFVRARLRKEVS
jgi:magnesium-transporting ATPase (P-type)